MSFRKCAIVEVYVYAPRGKMPVTGEPTLASLRRNGDPGRFFSTRLPTRDISVLKFLFPNVSIHKVTYDFCKFCASRKPTSKLERALYSAMLKELLRLNVVSAGLPLYVSQKLKMSLGFGSIVDLDKNYPLGLALAQSASAVMTPACVVSEDGWCGLSDTLYSKVWLVTHAYCMGKLCDSILRENRKLPFMYALVAPKIVGDIDKFMTKQTSTTWTLLSNTLGEARDDVRGLSPG